MFSFHFLVVVIDKNAVVTLLLPFCMQTKSNFDISCIRGGILNLIIIGEEHLDQIELAASFSI